MWKLGLIKPKHRIKTNQNTQNSKNPNMWLIWTFNSKFLTSCGTLGVNFSFLSGSFVFGRKFLASSGPLGVNLSFLSGLLMFGCKLFSRVVPFGINFSFLSGQFVCHMIHMVPFGVNLPPFVCVLPSQIFFYVSIMHFLFAWLLACTCVMKVESLKLKVRVFKTRKHLSFFFYLVFNTSSWKCTNNLFLACPHVCMIACMFVCVCVCVCVCVDSKFINLQNFCLFRLLTILAMQEKLKEKHL